MPKEMTQTQEMSLALFAATATDETFNSALNWMLAIRAQVYRPSESAPPEAPVAKTRTPRKSAALKKTIEEVERYATNCPDAEFEDYKGTLECNHGLQWVFRLEWTPEDWEKAQGVIKK